MSQVNTVDFVGERSFGAALTGTTGNEKIWRFVDGIAS